MGASPSAVQMSPRRHRYLMFCLLCQTSSAEHRVRILRPPSISRNARCRSVSKIRSTSCITQVKCCCVMQALTPNKSGPQDFVASLTKSLMERLFPCSSAARARAAGTSGFCAAASRSAPSTSDSPSLPRKSRSGSRLS
eukprot:scaffold363_cov255-Pinguiococcus_pyrenoidosus.AAC.5